MTQKQLEEYLWGAANILRGMIDAADFKQYIFPLLFFKRVSDIWDEECQEALDLSDGDMDYAKFRENHRFQIPDGCHWSDIRATSTDIGKKLQNALHEIENANFELLHDVFGDAQWTNKRRLSDEKLIDLIEHFSQMNLTVKDVPHDLMGDGYEYLINKFADDSGHTAAEFYTNRTVVELMTRITDPQPGESVYDPTCGSGGILLNSALYLKKQGKEYRNLKLYGQELNLITSAIARMNMFMHAIDEFLIVQGDTLDQPQILENDELKQFDVVMANPPYSIKRWSQNKFMNDPFGRNIWGTPPPGCADYAFQQHIIKSLKPDTGRSVSLWPHGVLFRDAEVSMRKKMIEGDLVEAVIGLGEKLFYNSSMESCLLVCNMNKSKDRKGKVLFINAKKEIRFELSNAYLDSKHIEKIAGAFINYDEIEGFSNIVDVEKILESKISDLSVQTYVKTTSQEQTMSVDDFVIAVNQNNDEVFFDSQKFVSSISSIQAILKGKKLTRYKWKECVDKLTRKIDPVKEGIERIVAGGNLESEDFKIRSWGTVGVDFLGPAFYMLFEIGDILYGSRRTYLKKVSVADFRGVCANTTFVVRAKEDVLLQDLLKHIMLSESFTQYSIGKSKGSTNPYINWKDLDDFEIDLPDINTQREIADKLDFNLELVEKIKSQESTLKQLRFKLVDDIMI